jgi:tetratricopeptide (TPR) repeat protein
MSDGNEKPKLQPPPRVPPLGANDAGSPAKSRPERANLGRQLVRAAALAVIFLALIGVFVVLPRWQEGRDERLAVDREAPVAAPETEIPATATPNPEPLTAGTRSEPSPIAAPTPAPQPAPIQPRNTPRHQLSDDQRLYVKVMSEGLKALEARQWEAALAAFDRASRLRPDAPEVADGMARARAGQRREAIADNLRHAHGLEQAEAWPEAEKMYTAVLAIDPESAVALAGQQRSDLRASLDEKLEYHLANPTRLGTSAVFDDAAACLEEALETVPSGPRLESQIARLEAVLERASTPVSVILESDAMTEVVVYRVGRLGTFTRRELALKPGTYTVIGSRAGYRDVRLQLVVTPGSPPKPLVVQCTERL